MSTHNLLAVAEDVPLVQFMYACQVRVTVGDSGLCVVLVVRIGSANLEPLCVDLSKVNSCLFKNYTG